MDLNCDSGNEKSSITMEIFAKLILDELKLIRKDMKEEISKLRCSMLKDSNNSVDASKEDENEFNVDLFSHENENIVHFSNTNNESLNGSSVEVLPICVKQEPITEEIFEQDSSSSFDVLGELAIRSNNDAPLASNEEVNNDNEIWTSFDGALDNSSEKPETSSFETEIADKNVVICSDGNPTNDYQQSHVNTGHDTSDLSNYNLHGLIANQSKSSMLVYHDEQYQNITETLQNKLQKHKTFDYQFHKPKNKTLLMWHNKDNMFFKPNANRKKHCQCKVCGKQFTQSGTCNRHMRIHSGEKPYHCNVCGKWFNQSGTLKTHKRIHTREKPYVCKICNDSFRQLNHLNRHEKSNH